MKTQEQANGKEKWEYRYSLLMALFLNFTLFFFAPLEIYFTVYKEVWFDIYHIIGLVLLMFAGAFGILSLLLLIVNRISRTGYRVITALASGMGVAAYVQGNILPARLGRMDGSEMKWSAFSWETILSVVIWCMIVGGFLCLLRFGGFGKMKNCSSVVMICILLVQIVTLCTLCITTDGLKRKDSAAFTTKNYFIHSTEKNVIILTLDMYDSEIFRDICAEGGQYQEMFDGFTYYPDAVGMYSETVYAVPHMLSGVRYAGEDMEEYLNHIYLESPFLNKLLAEDYKINIYTDALRPTEKAAYEMVDNYLTKEESHINVGSKRKMMMYLCKFTGIRYLPQPLKRFCWFYSEELWDLRDVDHENVFLPNSDNFLFDEKIDEMKAEVSDSMFYYYHIDGVHVPCYFDENFNETKENLAKSVDRENAIRNGKGILHLVDHFLSKIKELGIYDNSVIVILADHGGRLHYGEGQIDHIDRSNPLLLIKGFGERHSLCISENAVSYEDLQDAFVRLIDGKQGADVFPEIYTHDRARYFVCATNRRMYFSKKHAFDWQDLERVE